MALDLIEFDAKAKRALRSFWRSRDAAKLKQTEAGKLDHGERSGVTSGKNLDGFTKLIVAVVQANGLKDARILHQKALLTLPGYFRPTKIWDLVVLHQDKLVAAIELKSHVGPSFGNNFNNRAEESIGTAHDFWTAYSEGALGAQERPFVGWLMAVEDAPGSRKPVKDRSPHFDVFPEFSGASYLDRYEILCRRLVQKQLYTAACVLATPRSAVKDGSFAELSDMTGLRSFVATLAGHVASEAARSSG